MKRYSTHFAIVILLIAVFTGVIYFLISNYLFKLPISATTEGTRIDDLFAGHYLVISFLFSLVMTFLFYSAVIFRRKPGDQGDGEYMHGNTPLEIAWTVAPLGLVLVFAVWGTGLLNDLVSDENYPDPIVIQVIGKKWAWSYKYPEELGGYETNTLYLIKDRPVKLEMEALDVIHAFWVPEFRVKQDLLPGRKTYLRFTPNVETGETPFKVMCAEICGTSHSYMLSDVHVVGDQAAFTEALDRATALPQDPLARGQLWYETYGCNTCHSLDGTLDNYAGPTWFKLFGNVRKMSDGTEIIGDEAYIRNAIYAPNSQIVEGYAPGVMPQNFQQQFEEKQAQLKTELGQDIDIAADLIEFIKSLK